MEKFFGCSPVLPSPLIKSSQKHFSSKQIGPQVQIKIIIFKTMELFVALFMKMRNQDSDLVLQNSKLALDWKHSLVAQLSMRRGSATDWSFRSGEQTKNSSWLCIRRCKNKSKQRLKKESIYSAIV